MPSPSSRRRPFRIALARLSVAALVGLAGACTDAGSPPPQAVQPSPTTSTSSPAATAPALAGDTFGRIPEIVRNVQSSVVAVRTDRGEGSGVVWAADGVIVTNHHVIDGAGRVEIAFADGQRAQGRVTGSDPLTDLAVVQVDRRPLPPARFAQALPVVGELAIAMGNPLGFEKTATAGIISGLHRAVPGSAPETQALVDLIQTDAAISPGNSGGALVNAAGEVVGINVAYIPPEARAVSIGFAIPAPTVVQVVGQLLARGAVRHPFFGIQPGPLIPQIARQLGVDREAGVVVLDVVHGGPAAAAGIRPGDLIVSVEGKTVGSVEDFLAQIRGRAPGDQVRVTIVRDRREREVTVTLAERRR